MAGCDYNVIEMLWGFMFCMKVLYLNDEFVLGLYEINVISNRIKLNIFLNSERLETLNKVLSQVLSRQIRWHALTMEVFIKRIIWVLETFFWCVRP